MEFIELFVQFAVIISFGIWAYSKVKRQTIKDTIDEIKELISGVREKYG